MLRANLIATVLFTLGFYFSATGQSENPFELLWRTGGSAGTTAKSTPAPPANATIPTSPAIVPETTATKTPVSPPDTDGIERVTISLADTEVTPAVIDTLRPDTQQLAEVTPKTDTTGIAAIPDPVMPEPPARTEPPTRQKTTLSFVLLFGAIFSLLAWGMSLNRELLQKVYRAALNENLSSLLFREQRFATTQYLYYTIYLIFFVAGGMFLHFLGREFGWSAWIFQSVWSCIGLVTTVYVLRHLFLSILGNTYPIGKETSHFSFSILLHNILLGIGLIPVDLLLAFGPESMHRTVAIAGMALCGLVYLMRQFRGLLISGSLLGTNPFRFFIYLCAVEFLPLITLVKFFHN